jgi:hypothetical protein
MANDKLPTWDELVAVQPGLNDLLIEAQTFDTGDDCSFCKLHAFGTGDKGHQSFKARLYRLVGFGARGGSDDTILRTCWAYDLATKVILNALPPCGDCCICYDCC